MAQNKQKETVNFSEISTIRNILMGEQMSEYEHLFKKMEDKLEVLNAELSNKIEQLDKKQEAYQMQSDTNFKKLENDLMENVKQLQQQAKDLSQQDRNHLSNLLIEVASQLKS